MYMALDVTLDEATELDVCLTTAENLLPDLQKSMARNAFSMMIFVKRGMMLMNSKRRLMGN